MDTNCTVIVSSCDAYKDCWAPFIFSIKKYWGDLSMPIFILSNYENHSDEKINFLLVGEDKGWASNLKKALGMINTDYIMYLQEDYWLTDYVDNNRILEHINYCRNYDIDMLRLSYPYFDKYPIDDIYADSPLNKKYALCLQPAIWKKTSLTDILIDGWSGWDFESKICNFICRHGIAFNSQVVLSTVASNYRIHYVGGTGVRKGRWTNDAESYLYNNGFQELIKNRKVEGKVLDKLIKLRKSILLKIPVTLLIRLMNKFDINF